MMGFRAGADYQCWQDARERLLAVNRKIVHFDELAGLLLAFDGLAEALSVISGGHLNRSCRLRCRMKFPVCSPVHVGAQRYLHEDQPLPMLHSRDKEPTLAGLILDAEEFTLACILPRNDGERLYLDLFAKGVIPEIANQGADSLKLHESALRRYDATHIGSTRTGLVTEWE